MNRNKYITFLLVIVFLFGSTAFSQSKTNIEVYYSLVDSAAGLIAKRLPAEQNKIVVISNKNDYSIFTNRIKSTFNKLGVAPDSGVNTELTISFDRTTVQYSDMHRESFFGSMWVKRKVEFGGNFSFNNKIAPGEFLFSAIDSVKVDDIKKIENPVYPFTVSEVPPEPFFSSLLEPAAAIGTAAVAIYLFFSVRSK
ncbi:MAG: hypothetical protein K8H86_13965 [Ignavibacteriaceae bacterium]|nr:hypothetical protein [Ignavibacteriaceae bacterium]